MGQLNRGLMLGVRELGVREITTWEWPLLVTRGQNLMNWGNIRLDRIDLVRLVTINILQVSPATNN